jgi:hypothetical protein
MSTYKKFTSNDIIVTPFTVNKAFSEKGTPPGFSQTKSTIFGGVYSPSNFGVPIGEGTGSTQQIYQSIKHLYYSNYLSGSTKRLGNIDGSHSDGATASFNPDGTISGPAFTTNYDNNIQSITDNRHFIDGSGLNIFRILSIPSKLYGESIKPGSFVADGTGASTSLSDDGEGNLVNQDGTKVGNIIYNQGIIIFTGINGGGGSTTFANPNWESTVTIYETQYKCTIRANEFNYSLNPTLLSSSLRGNNNILSSGSSTYSKFVTGSDFSPFVTTVGLYNDDQELIAVGKLSQPLNTSQTTDTTILINLDR